MCLGKMLDIINFEPEKMFINDLSHKTPPTGVWLQGTIEQTIGNDILIISDGTGRAKIVKCGSADGIINKNSIKKGTYCCIIGTAIKTHDLPEIEVMKFIDLTAKAEMKSIWDVEVKEAQLFLQGLIKPVI